MKGLTLNDSARFCVTFCVSSSIMTKIPIEISARHVHLSQKDLDTLFGRDYKLKSIKKLSQDDEFAAKERVTIKSERSRISNVRIVGPVRSHTQAEISKTDARELEIDPPVKECTACVGEEAESIMISGPKGEIEQKAAIISHRHIHISPKQAQELGLKDHEQVSVMVEGKRSLTFHSVLARVKEGFNLAMHLDTDEANAAGVEGEIEGELIN